MANLGILTRKPNKFRKASSGSVKQSPRKRGKAGKATFRGGSRY